MPKAEMTELEEQQIVSKYLENLKENLEMAIEDPGDAMDNVIAQHIQYHKLTAAIVDDVYIEDEKETINLTKIKEYNQETREKFIKEILTDFKENIDITRSAIGEPFSVNSFLITTYENYNLDEDIIEKLENVFGNVEAEDPIKAPDFSELDYVQAKNYMKNYKRLINLINVKAVDNATKDVILDFMETSQTANRDNKYYDIYSSLREALQK